MIKTYLILAGNLFPLTFKQLSLFEIAAAHVSLLQCCQRNLLFLSRDLLTIPVGLVLSKKVMGDIQIVLSPIITTDMRSCNSE